MIQRVFMLFEDRKDLCLWGGCILAALGVIVRLGQYLSQRSFWVDEIALYYNLLERDLWGLLSPLDYNQAAPVGFLLASELMTELFGFTEYSMRFLPMIAGVGSVVVFALAAFRLFGSSWMFLLSIGAFSFCYELVVYSQEFKQYSFDVLASLCLLTFAVTIIKLKSVSWKTYGWFVLLGCIVIPFSHPVIFVLAATGLVLLMMFVNRSHGLRIEHLLLAGIAWIGIWGLNYYFFIDSLGGHHELNEYWRDMFLPLPTSRESLNTWLVLLSDFLTFMGYSQRWQLLALLLGFIGVVNGFLEKRYEIFLICFVFCFTILSSVVGKFPFQGRLVLFLIPFFLLLMFEGAKVISEHNKKWLAVWVMIFISLPTLISFGKLVRSPILKEESRSLIFQLDSSWDRKIPLYSYYSSQHSIKFYQPNILDEDLTIIGVDPRLDWSHYEKEVASLTRHSSFWALFIHTHGDAEQRFVHTMNESSAKVKSWKRVGASLYYIELSD